MNHKVLLADDSLTIQKVIKITLANQPYDITEASNEDELFQKLAQVQPKLVFLDFNLSEKFTGYELTTKIKSTVPTAKVLLLLGTFDTIDDAAMEKCGASDKIVKPFDSNKFIAICKHLADTSSDETIDYPEPKAEDEEINLIEESPEDQWTVSHTSPQVTPQVEARPEPTNPKMPNPLLKEVSDWGMSVPGVIDGASPQDQMINIPPVIAETKTSAPSDKHEIKFPHSDDLDYPTLDEAPVEVKPVAEEVKPATTSKFISLETLNQPAEEEFEVQGSYVPEESDVSSIEAQIADEVASDLWQADEFEDLKKEVSNKMEEVKTHFQPSRNDFDESLFKPIDDPQSIDWSDTTNLFKQEKQIEVPGPIEHHTHTAAPVDMSHLRDEMEQMVKKYVKEYMDEYFKKNAEKVAWEVIPDLAENLIRQELSKISNKILND